MTPTNARDSGTHSEAVSGGTSATEDRSSSRRAQNDTAATTRRTLLGLVAASAALTTGSGAVCGTNAASHDDADQYKQIVKQHSQCTAEGNLDGCGSAARRQP